MTEGKETLDPDQYVDFNKDFIVSPSTQPMMNATSIRIALTAWPVLVFAVLALPLPGVPFIAAFAVLVGACVLLAKSNLDLRVGKTIIGMLWLVASACLVYFFIAFGAGVDATDVGRAVPTWAKMDWVAGLIGVLALLSATVALWLPPQTQPAIGD